MVIGEEAFSLSLSLSVNDKRERERGGLFILREIKRKGLLIW